MTPRPVAVALRALKLGDLLTAIPALRALRRGLPEHRLVLAAPVWLAPLAELSGAVDVLVDTAALAPLAAELQGADVAVNLHGRGPQSSALLTAAEPGRLIAYGVEGGPAWDEGDHEVVRWCRLLAAAGFNVDPTDLRLDRPPVEAPPLAVGATLIHPGAASGARRWPAERWAAVACAEEAAGRRVVVTGAGAAEVALAHEVAERAGLPGEAVVAGATDLLQLTAAVAVAGRVASGDTGVSHLATAMGSPSVTLFGPTPPSRWGPPPSPRHRVLWAGRTGDPHVEEPDPGLLAIGVTDVVTALEAVAAETAAAGS